MLLAVALLSLLPMGRLLLAALAPGGELDVAAFFERLATPSALRATWHTLDTAIFGAVLAMLIGAPFAVAVAMTDLPGRRPIGFLLLLPLMIAPQVTALSWLHLFGPSSVLLSTLGIAPPPGTPNPVVGREGIILLYGVQHAPIVFVTLRVGLARIPRDFVEAARAAGSGTARVLATIVLPLMRPYLIAAAALAFVSGVGNFGIAALLGLPVNYLTLPTLIYRQMSSFGPACCRRWRGCRVLIALLALAGVAGPGVGHRARRALFRRHPGAPAARPVALAGSYSRLVRHLLPARPADAGARLDCAGPFLRRQAHARHGHLLQLQRGADPAGGHHARLPQLDAAVARGSVILALGAVPLAIGMERFGARSRRWLQGALELPYAVPGIVLAIACILLFLRPLPLIGSLYATAWIILVAYLMRFATFAAKPVATAVRQIPRELDEAAAASGAGALRRTWTITAPLAAPAAVAGALLVFMGAFNELTVSALLWSGGNETLGVVLFSLEEAGLATHAAAIAVTTIVAVILILAVLDRLSARLPAGVLPWR